MDDDIEVSNRIRFFRACAADCRAYAAGVSLSQSKDAYLEFAAAWDRMAKELEVASGGESPQSSGEHREPNAAA
jgi:hypothetical protein